MSLRALAGWIAWHMAAVKFPLAALPLVATPDKQESGKGSDKVRGVALLEQEQPSALW